MTRMKVLVLGVLAAMFLSACDASVYSLPLPGGPDVGDDPMTIKVEFADVLDLVPQSTVKVNDVSVGKVTAIDLEGYQALVTLQVRRDVDLPGNAVAELRQTSLLGEKFVQLSAPDEGAIDAPLSDGSTIPIERAGRNPEVEEVLGALSPCSTAAAWRS
jgi:phospholipid/cholesterol/gamma-HCH transport system substrate-binding protein